MPSVNQTGYFQLIGSGFSTRLLGLVGLALGLLYLRPLLFPILVQDDFQILSSASTWEKSLSSIWVPQNEHAMPLGRIWTRALFWISGSVANLPRVLFLASFLAFCLVLWLVYWFLNNEIGNRFSAWLGVVLFGITSLYQQAIWWFAASFSLLSLLAILLGLLCAQKWKSSRKPLFLDLAVLSAILAPCFFASGILGGPLLCVYLYLTSPRESQSALFLIPGKTFSTLPLLGSFFFLAISFPRTSAAILHLEHYEGKTAVENFQPLGGLLFTARSVVDNLMLGAMGISMVEVPLPLVFLILGILCWAAWKWWINAKSPALLFLGFWMILLGYWLPYSARVSWGYEGIMTQPAWGRYHLIPHLGLVFFFVGGLSGKLKQTLSEETNNSITGPQFRILVKLVFLLVLFHLPRAWISYPSRDLEQAQLLEKIDAMNQKCVQNKIHPKVAAQVLPPLDLSRWSSQVNGWELLSGNGDAQEQDLPNVREILLSP